MKKLTEKTRLLVPAAGNLAGYKIGFVRAGESARQEFQGPLVPGPWAFAFALAHVIDNYGGTGGEIEREAAAGLVVRAELGEQVEIDGQIYTIEAAANDNISLRPAAAATAATV